MDQGPLGLAGDEDALAPGSELPPRRLGYPRPAVRARILVAPVFSLALAAPLASPGEAAAAVAPARTFDTELRALAWLVACTPAPTPIPLPVPDVDHRAYCGRLERLFAQWKRRWFDRARPVLEEIVPLDTPEVVVYPFGGGDLLSALATYPRARELTTLSLEGSGSPVFKPPMPGTTPEALAPMVTALARFRLDVQRLIVVSHSKTLNLRGLRKEPLFQQLAFALVGLAALGHRPVGLRYFAVEPDGNVRYLAAGDGALPGRAPYLHVELAYRHADDPPAAPPRIYRHLSVNLDDEHLRAEPGILRHLEAKGPVAALTKAASHLLWWDSFSEIRAYLLRRAELMISDATGIPPRHAGPAGFVQVPYGRYAGPFLKVGSSVKQEMIDLWAAAPFRPLSFFYGYPDAAGEPHLLLTRRRAKDELREPAAQRLETPQGPVRIFFPRGYRANQAGLVIYVHGLYTDVDTAWSADRLAEQFTTSGRNAAFVTPASRTDKQDQPRWGSLEELLTAIPPAAAGAPQLPDGPIVLAGHSGAYKQLALWLTHSRVQRLVLLDGFYGNEAEMKAWIEAPDAGHRAALVGKDTADEAEAFFASAPYAVLRTRLPIRLEQLTSNERQAKLLLLRTATDHFALIRDGRALPLLLRWAGLPAL